MTISRSIDQGPIGAPEAGMAIQNTQARPGDRSDADIARTFEQALAVEMLESQALRTLALGSLLACASLFIAFVAVDFYLSYGMKAAWVPMTVLPVVVVVAIYEFVTRYAIKRHIALGTSVPIWVWYANACAEISAMTALIVFIHGSVSNPIYALSTPPLAGYFLFIVLSTLYLDFRLSLFTGSLAAIQYLGVVVYTFSIVGVESSTDTVFLTPGPYLAKAMILFMAGAGAAFVAREVRRRQLTSLRAFEERDREHRENTLKSQFLADMSHEIRTPLNAVIGYAQLLETDDAITPSQRKSVEAIRIGGRHLLSVVNDVLDISKIEAGSETVTESRFDLRAVLQELTLIFAARCAEKRISWIFDMKSEPGEVSADEAKLRQVLTNILGNAVKFTQSGHVAMRVIVGENDLYTFEIEDTGPGIAQERQQEIFDPFAQDMQGRLNGGTGLGLAIAQRYVGLMGGEITVRSSPGDGACFRFSVYLPRAGARKSATEAQSAARSLRLAPGQVVQALVADDVVANREILSAMLERAGVTVHAAADGTEALAVLKEARIDIAYLDIRMPRMTGLEVARHIAGADRDKPKLVAVSASALTHQREEYTAAGFDDFLDKPVQMARVFESMTRLLNVSFEEDTKTDTPVPVPISTLPHDLLRSLTEAAQRHNITDLRRLIGEVETLGDAERIFAAELRNLCGTYDMKAVLAALETIGHD
jgi:signal transduction histidine kinase/DNA-binding NarL/FixJ family response regulator